MSSGIQSGWGTVVTMAFIAVLAGLLALSMVYLGGRDATESWHWVLLSVLCLFSLMLPLFHGPGMKRDGGERIARAVLQQFTYASMGWISSLFGLTVLRDLVLLLWGLAGGGAMFADFYAATTGTPMFIASGVLTLLGLSRGAWGPRVREVRVVIAGLPRALENLTIAQISDLHIGPSIGRRYVERVVRNVLKQKADFTVLTGDIVDAPLEQVGPVVKLLGALGGRDKVFYSLGNHEYYWGVGQRPQLIEAYGPRVLINQGVALKHNGAEIWMAGITDPVAGDGKHAPSVESAAKGGEAADLRVLLSHRPHFVEEAARAGFDLQLSGHTHGGQFFPWNFVARFFHRYFLGLMKFENIWIYVNPGTGSWGPLIRMGTTPEITLLKLVRG